MRAALVLYEGRYSDAVTPHEHYIPVAHDHSNLEDVFQAIADTDGLQAMVDRAHRHLIESGRFSYRAFVAQVEAALERHVRMPPRGGMVQVEPQHTDVRKPALEELPTAMPRSFDSFQLRSLLARLGSPPSAARLFLRAMGLGRVRGLLVRIAPSLFGH